MALFGPKRIGLALGSGAARGIAHIGVLKVLEAEGLVPDVVTGTSMGALVGAFYAAGIPIAEIESIAVNFDPREVTGVGEMAIGRGAVFSGQKVQSFLRTYLPATFEELQIPFGCVATDMIRNEPVRFTSGDLVSAIRASVSVPLAFLPVRMDDMLLVDGYVSDPVPVGFARYLGGQTIVAVDVSGNGTVNLTDTNGAHVGARQRLHDLRATMKSGAVYERSDTGLDIMAAVSEAFEARLAQPALRAADIVISPDVHYLTGFSFGQAVASIEAGEQATRASLASIRRKSRRQAGADW